MTGNEMVGIEREIAELRGAIRALGAYVLRHSCGASSETLLHQRARRALEIVERGREHVIESDAS